MIKILSLPLLALACAAQAPLSAQGCNAALMDVTAASTAVQRYGHLRDGAMREEVAVMLWLQRTRTQADIARVRFDSTPTLECFTEELAHDPNPGLIMPHRPYRAADHPRTRALLAHAREDLLPLVSALRNYYARPRPYVTYPAILPVEEKLTTPSFPSSTAALGCVYAQILSQFRPDLREALCEKGCQLGADRVLAGSHYPSDVLGGEMLGKAFATAWINQPEHRQLIKEVCEAEWR